jgi:hypothetical protein
MRFAVGILTLLLGCIARLDDTTIKAVDVHGIRAETWPVVLDATRAIYVCDTIELHFIKT